MEEINAFKCSHGCNKNFESEQSCKSNECKCYFNPKTESCESCAFLRYYTYNYNWLQTISLHTCIRNIDVTGELKTQCQSYLTKVAGECKEQLDEALAKFNPIPFVKEHLKSVFDITTEGEISVYENYTRDKLDHVDFISEAYIGKLVAAVGHNLMLLLESEYKNKFTPIDELAGCINNHDEEIHSTAELLAAISKIDFIKEIIDSTARKFPRSIIYAYSLINQGEIKYHMNMSMANKTLNNHFEEEYHLYKAMVVKNSIDIESKYNPFFQAERIEVGANVTRSCISNIVNICLGKIDEVTPGLVDIISEYFCRFEDDFFIK